MFEADSNEPKEMFVLLAPTLDELEIGPLNQNGYSDYTWQTYEGIRKQTERKTWNELLGGLDDVEEQMQRHLNAFPDDEHVFLLEGMAVKTDIGSVTLKPSANGKVYVRGFPYKKRMKAMYSWLYEIGKYVEVIQTTGLSETATALVAMYEADQKENHKTLHRHIKTMQFTADPVILQYMNILPRGIGERTAEALKTRFSNMKELCRADAIELVKCEGIGATTARSIMQALGTY